MRPLNEVSILESSPVTLICQHSHFPARYELTITSCSAEGVRRGNEQV